MNLWKSKEAAETALQTGLSGAFFCVLGARVGGQPDLFGQSFERHFPGKPWDKVHRPEFIAPSVLRHLFREKVGLLMVEVPGPVNLDLGYLTVFKTFESVYYPDVLDRLLPVVLLTEDSHSRMVLGFSRCSYPAPGSPLALRDTLKESSLAWLDSTRVELALDLDTFFASIKAGVLPTQLQFGQHA